MGNVAVVTRAGLVFPVGEDVELLDVVAAALSLAVVDGVVDAAAPALLSEDPVLSLSVLRFCEFVVGPPMGTSMDTTFGLLI